MAYIIAAVDGIYINGSLVAGSSFDPDGELGNWGTYTENGEITPVADSEFVYDGTYGARLDSLPDYEFSTALLSYELFDFASTDVITIWYRIIEADGTSGEEDGAVFDIYAYDFEYNEGPHPVQLYYGYEDTPVTEPLAWAQATIDFSGLNIESGIVIVAYATSFTAGVISGGEASATIYFDDFTLTAGATWDGFKNGDFELGTLENWTVAGNATIDISVVHGGTYSCELSTYGDSISQRIDLTDMNMLNMWYNIPDTSGYIQVDIKEQDTTLVMRWTDYAITDGWYKLRLDTSACSGEYIITVATYGATAYVDDITPAASFDTTLAYGTFETGTMFHTASGDSATSTITTDGIDNSRCARLYPYHAPWFAPGHQYAYVYDYINVSNADSISFWYRIPTFDKGYANMGGAWLRARLEQDGSPTLNYTVATATVGGSIPDWTFYTIDTSDITGTYKFTVYADTEEAGYTLHPSMTAYIDNILASVNINLLSSLCLYQYIDDDLITDVGYDVFETTDIGHRRISHKLTDIGHHLIFPVVTSRDDLAEFIDKTINITTRLIMKLRRVKP